MVWVFVGGVVVGVRNDLCMARDGRKATLASLRLARESRDGYPMRFAPELEALVLALCGKLEVPADDTALAVRIVHMYDLGLLAADGEALNAPRPLTDDERDQLSRWPQAASLIAQGIPGQEELAPALASLNEWWDGSHGTGKTSGDAIPIASRVVAVALAYVAMSRSRPHRAALAPEEIVDQLRKTAGTRYDSRVVEALAALVANG
ncbi:MAG: hypothetical protein JHC87_02965 [Thermoleophilaceae bacterium]|nr:hypothetical protein [Thermoleophilaceae bacterium]